MPVNALKVRWKEVSFEKPDSLHTLESLLSGLSCNIRLACSTRHSATNMVKEQLIFLLIVAERMWRFTPNREARSDRQKRWSRKGFSFSISSCARSMISSWTSLLKCGVCTSHVDSVCCSVSFLQMPASWGCAFFSSFSVGKISLSGNSFVRSVLIQYTRPAMTISAGMSAIHQWVSRVVGGNTCGINNSVFLKKFTYIYSRKNQGAGVCETVLFMRLLSVCVRTQKRCF